MHLNPFAISGLLVGTTCTGLATVVFLYRSSKLHRLYGLHTLSVAIWGYGSFLIGITVNPSISFLLWKIAYVVVILIPIFFLHTVMTLCNKFKRWLLYFAYLQAIIFIFLNINGRLFWQVKLLFNSFYYIQMTWIGFISFLFWASLVIYEHYELLKFYIVTKHENKLKFFYFLIASLFGFGGGVTNFLPSFNIDFYPYGNFFIPIYCIIMTYTLLRHQFMDIKIVIQKGLVYSVLVAIITAGYLIFVISIGKVFEGLVGYQSFILNLFAIFVIAILFNPLRNKIQLFLDRRFFKGTLESLTKESEYLRQQLFQFEKLAYVGNLASSVAHEIKNPLTAIKTFVEYLPQKYNDPEFKEKFQRHIPKEIERITKVVNQLLEIARPHQPSLREINIIDTIDSTLSLLENNLKLKKINVKKAYESNEVLIKADEEQLKQVFLNLFLNAIQAMKEEGVLEISTNLRSSGESKSVVICVKDTGCGISQENLNKLFTPFFTTKKEGVGLGLVITKEIIDAHNGTIDVDSKVSEGTKFMIKFSLKDTNYRQFKANDH